MMEDHFGLERAPFRLGTDASFYYEAEAHRRAMAHLRYGLRQAEGFVVVTGEPGVGKTMVVEQLLLSVQDSDVLAGMLIPNGLTPANLGERVLAAFDRQPVDGADPRESLRGYLADERRRGAKASLIVDEAQHLSDAVLEELRLISDLTDEGEALLQVCLIGQTGLRRVLFRDDMEQLRQRIVASYHLAPLSAEDTEAYIQHRMKAAGHEGSSVFTPDALGMIHRLSGGVPRRINTLCARLLEQAAAEGRAEVDSDDAQSMAGDDTEEGPEPDEALGATPSEPMPEAPAAPPRPAPGPPKLTVVENDPPTAEAEIETDRSEIDDEEAEAERALALVTASPRDIDAAPAPHPDPAAEVGEGYRMRTKGSGTARGYPVTVGEINAAIQSIQTGTQDRADEKEPAPTAPPKPPMPRRRVASPQELMARGVRTEPASEAVPDHDRSDEARTGDQERVLRAFLDETGGALAELRAAMAVVKERVADLEEQRRARRDRIDRAVEEAQERLDALRRER